ncbi:elongation of very long chain fatty acids protein 6-like [Mercenaria mercenaria]|uniref:elongation of very long chain fatty acids protein 6-like n=1 Tax=Mercenaria mercenaria TaxID=6596 RepID=UPI00234F30AB|nr:elongation of very long chain fatty acids protein 6-like [Mercenaria mercenaria]
MDMSNRDPANMTFLPFEKNHNAHAFDDYLRRHWTDSFIYSGIYVIVVFGCQFLMKNRERFELRPYLAIWSGLLAVFSIMGTIRTVPELIWAVKYNGFEYSCCSGSYLEHGKVSSFWGCLFALSKVAELGDTLFMVLRKQQLIFLHWYHHITVLIYVWYSYPDHIGTARYFMVMNFTVHSVMYSYYTLRALKYNLPKWISMLITSLQLVQMFSAITVTVISYNALSSGRECATNYSNIGWSMIMYFSYLVLFARFFYMSYIKKGSVIHEKKT